jgi:hypothetical protein
MLCASNKLKIDEPGILAIGTNPFKDYVTISTLNSDLKAVTTLFFKFQNDPVHQDIGKDMRSIPYILSLQKIP